MSLTKAKMPSLKDKLSVKEEAEQVLARAEQEPVEQEPVAEEPAEEGKEKPRKVGSGELLRKNKKKGKKYEKN